MATFRSELERLTRLFVTSVIEAVESEVRREQQERRELAQTRKRRTRREIVAERGERKRAQVAARALPAARAKAAEPTVVRVEPIVLPAWTGVKRRRRASPSALGDKRRQPKIVVPKPEASVTFEVVPHPVRAGRRLVMTRIGS